MSDQKSYGSPTSNTNLPLQADVNYANVHENLPPSANSTDNLAVNLVEASRSVSTLVDIYDGEAIDPAYQAKSHAISCAIQQIGMGRYQVRSPHCVRKPSSEFR